MTDHKMLDMVQRIDFDRLNAVVTERITALALAAQQLDQLDGPPELAEAMCCDLILPAVGLLTEFIQSVQVETPA